MKKLKYSPDALEKLNGIKAEVTDRFGRDKALLVIAKITKSLRKLQQYEYAGVSVERAIGISCDYYMLFVEHNYVFYRIGDDAVWITDIFHEREDFMWSLFGIRRTTQETEDYWEE